MNDQTRILGEKLAAPLLAEGRMSRTDMARLVERATESDCPAPGWYLVEGGIIEPEEWAERLAAQFGMVSARLADFQVDHALVQRVPEDIARRYRLLPVTDSGAEVYVATCNPTAIDAFDRVAHILGRPVLPVLVPPTDIDEGLRRHYIDEDISDLEHLEAEEFDMDGGAEARLRAEGAADQVVDTVDRILAHGISAGASDIHLEPFADGLYVRFRIDGMLREGPRYPRSMTAPVASRIKVLAQLDIAERFTPQDGRVRLRKNDKQIDLRISCLPVTNGEKIVIRILGQSSVQKSLASLGFDDYTLQAMRDELRRPNGMFLVTGPTGSGKSTTLYSSLCERIDPTINVVTVEDPVEYEVHGINQVPINVKRGVTFQKALRSILRQDPDVILVGEIRDTETGIIAAEAAMTGHLLLSTLHTNDSVAAVQRLLEIGVPKHMIAPSLNAVLAQRLMRKVCRACCRPYQPDQQQLDELIVGLTAGSIELVESVGCEQCDRTGYSGRNMVYELFRMDDELRAMVSAGAPTGKLRSRARAKGMPDLRANALERVFARETTVSELTRVVCGTVQEES